MPYETLLTSLEDGVMTVTLNRPDKLNAFNKAMHHGLMEAVGRIERDDAVRAVLITGAGRGFSSGADLKSGFDPHPVYGMPDIR